MAHLRVWPHHQGVYRARTLHDIITRPCDPVVLFVVPLSAQGMRGHLAAVPVLAKIALVVRPVRHADDKSAGAVLEAKALQLELANPWKPRRGREGDVTVRTRELLRNPALISDQFSAKGSMTDFSSAMSNSLSLDVGFASVAFKAGTPSESLTGLSLAET
jgi:hypothetical protein